MNSHKAILSDDEVDAALISLLGTSTEPEPLEDALASNGALSGGELGNGDAEGGVVGGELGEGLVGVALELDERVTDNRVGGGVNDGHVARTLVGDGQDSGEIDYLARGEGLHTVDVVIERGATAEEEIAYKGPEC